jgi:hypothetical protein
VVRCLRAWLVAHVCERLECQTGRGDTGACRPAEGRGTCGSSLGAQRRVTSHTGPVDAQRSEALLDGGGARRDPCQGGVKGGGTREWCRCY